MPWGLPDLIPIIEMGFGTMRKKRQAGHVHPSELRLDLSPPPQPGRNVCPTQSQLLMLTKVTNQVAPTCLHTQSFSVIHRCSRVVSGHPQDGCLLLGFMHTESPELCGSPAWSFSFLVIACVFFRLE